MLGPVGMRHATMVSNSVRSYKGLQKDLEGSQKFLPKVVRLLGIGPRIPILFHQEVHPVSGSGELQKRIPNKS